MYRPTSRRPQGDAVALASVAMIIKIVMKDKYGHYIDGVGGKSVGVSAANAYRFP